MIDGPFTLSVLEKQFAKGRELHLDFMPEFRGLPLSEQEAAFRDHLARLSQAIAATGHDSHEMQGLLTVQHVAGQRLPYASAGEMVLDETLVIEIGAHFSLARSVTGDRIN